MPGADLAQERRRHSALVGSTSCALVLLSSPAVWAGTTPRSVAENAPRPAEDTSDVDELQAEKPTSTDNSLFFEALGSALVYSFNYERRVIRDVGLRLGFGAWPITSEHDASSNSKGGSVTQSLVFIPVSASYLGLRAGRSALELGAGVTLACLTGYTDPNGVSTPAVFLPIAVALAGYRYQRVDRPGLMFRIGAEAMEARGDFLPWPYVSVGASF